VSLLSGPTIPLLAPRSWCRPGLRRCLACLRRTEALGFGLAASGHLERLEEDPLLPCSRRWPRLAQFGAAPRSGPTMGWLGACGPQPGDPAWCWPLDQAVGRSRPDGSSGWDGPACFRTAGFQPAWCLGSRPVEPSPAAERMQACKVVPRFKRQEGSRRCQTGRPVSPRLGREMHGGARSGADRPATFSLRTAIEEGKGTGYPIGHYRSGRSPRAQARRGGGPIASRRWRYEGLNGLRRGESWWRRFTDNPQPHAADLRLAFRQERRNLG